MNRPFRLAAALFLLTAAHGLLAAEAKPPRIVHVMLDDWGYYEMSGLGHPMLETPHMDQLMREGLRFTCMLAGGSVCAPTRCALMTGRHPGHMTVVGNSGQNAIRADEPTVASMLKAAGYATGGFGKWGLGARGTVGVPEKHGFDVFFGYYDQVCTFSDVMPTLAEIAGAALPAVAEGISLAPTLLGREGQRAHDWMVWGGSRNWALRQGRWKALGNAKGTLLYDLETDVGETRDVAPEHADLVAKMKAIAEKAFDPGTMGEIVDPGLVEKDRKAKGKTAGRL